jgi:hypothetical protein
MVTSFAVGGGVEKYLENKKGEETSSPFFMNDYLVLILFHHFLGINNITINN